MGNETSILKKCNVSCKPQYTTSEWSLFDATHEKQSFSAFIFNENESCNNFTEWKHVRHPYLVKFYEAGSYKNKKYILTEPVLPLRQILDKFHRFSKLSGLYNIGDALLFLHEICNISVNNLSIDSIYISKNDPNELWKIGSLYWCSSINSEDKEFLKSMVSSHNRNGTLKTLPPEDRDLKDPTLIGSLKDIHRRDVYAFVSLIEELFYNPENPPKLVEMLLVSENENITNHNFMAKTLIENFISFNFDKRPTISTILNNPLFKNCPFVQLRQFLSNFSTYNDQEKYSFLKVLIQNLRQFTDQSLVVSIFTMIVSSRFIMSNRLVYNHVMPYLLIPSTTNNEEIIENSTKEVNNGQSRSTGNSKSNQENSYVLTNGETITLSPFIDSKTFRDSIIPLIINLYCVHDYKIRILLLKYLPHYGSFIPKNCLKKILLPQILLGIKDSDKELVSLTFRAVAVLIDLFGVVLVLGGSNRSRYFTSGVSGDNKNSRNFETCDTRRNSSSSLKSSLYDEKIGSMIFERSSPDGDETIEFNSPLNKNSIAKFSLDTIANGESIDNEWPEWEENLNVSQLKTISIQSNSKSTKHVSKNFETSSNEKIHSLKEKFQTYDIKEIDFKEVNYSKEIDNLFMDMAPMLNFNYKKFISNSIHQVSSLEKNAKQEESDIIDPSFQSHQIDTSLFEAKNELNIQDIENSGWDDGLDWNDVNGTTGSFNNTPELEETE